ncbi:hypothetical protein UFOVP447_143 [uncultured Caudovirales phage]|uniref:Uncharacterized protein n=1 Tax=uncultured Caudovirales phage TaxID=2100421 RepID=A0A6J5MEB5_9CAUD|nr:hypothetical protein UFOVP447_143 [uncultured Caudovirales phage]
MPTYTFRDKTTGEEWDEFLSFSGREERLKDPNIEQVPCAPVLISGISGVTHKNDSGFNDMMSRIAAANPNSPLADKYGDKGVKASKTREAVKKAKAKMAS